MRSITQLKSLGDIRTIISTHTRSTPRHEGSTYLDILSLGMEKQRLEAELDWLARRRGRIEQRLHELRGIMENRLNKAQEETTPGSLPSAAGPGERRADGAANPDPRKWKSMAVEY